MKDVIEQKTPWWGERRREPASDGHGDHLVSTVAQIWFCYRCPKAKKMRIASFRFFSGQNSSRRLILERIRQALRRNFATTYSNSNNRHVLSVRSSRQGYRFASWKHLMQRSCVLNTGICMLRPQAAVVKGPNNRINTIWWRRSTAAILLSNATLPASTSTSGTLSSCILAAAFLQSTSSDDTEFTGNN